ncbi:unnamed protein product [Periconia digitata]|uniref:Uncharacterized protein n=1 Tax=Periconia digitata TaxID=1303443 RepID=A0A9W4XK31_9PLEO|nr:unnamed protein product [Periconia digitata]
MLRWINRPDAEKTRLLDAAFFMDLTFSLILLLFPSFPSPSILPCFFRWVS